jgi:integrase
MPKILKEAPLTTKEARAGLPAGEYFRGLDEGVHLMYKKGKRGGTWFVRWRHTNGSYHRLPVGIADDNLKTGTIDFYSASKKARAIVEKVRQDAIQATDPGPALTISAGVETYIAARDARESRRSGRQKRSDAGQRLRRYVLGQPARGRQPAMPAASLAAIELQSLSEADLRSWRDGLPATMKATTHQRLINDLKAALNGVYGANRKSLPPTLPETIRHGLRSPDADEAEPIARDNQILPDADVGRIVRAAREIDQAEGWEGDLFRLVLVLAASGSRFSQVARMRVSDCQIAACRLMVPGSRKGRGSKPHTITVPVGRDVMDELVPVTTGRSPDAPLLERWRHVQSRGSIDWHRDSRGKWTSAAELVRPWRSIRERAGLPELIPYALRHSSIVRGIRANLPVRLVAALHDTSVKMIEQHYSRWITDGLEDLARVAVVPIVLPADGRD